MRSPSGRLLGAPLAAGSRFCALHLQLFATSPPPFGTCDVVVFYLDFETTGLDLRSGRSDCHTLLLLSRSSVSSSWLYGAPPHWFTDQICEVAVTEALSAAPFSTTVCPVGLLDGPPGVHGIDAAELRQSPPFPVAFKELLGFLRTISEHIFADVDSSDEEFDVVTVVESPMFPPPRVLLAAHNGSLTSFV